MPDEPREIRIKRPASHIHCSRCLSFIPRHRVRRKQAFTELGRTRWNCNTCCSDGSGGAGALAREVGDVHVGADAFVCPVERSSAVLPVWQLACVVRLVISESATKCSTWNITKISRAGATAPRAH